jgi:hypothetical protein
MIGRISFAVITVMLAFYITASGVVPTPVRAESERYERGESYEHEGRGFWGERGRRGEEDEAVPRVMNKTYLKECGACHFPYQPALLPQRSWKKILGNLEDHYGDDASLDEETLGQIKAYVFANSAETTRNEVSSKILKRERGRTPLGISETRYFKKEHRKIKPSVIKRESIGSFSNCIACHRSADRGIYEEDFIRIPRR